MENTADEGVHNNALKESLRNLFDSAIDDYVLPGYSAAIVTPSKLVTFVGGRFTYDKESLPVLESTLYDVASITKIVGPMSIMMHLVDIGKVALNDKVTKYFSSFNSGQYKDEVTIRHLLTYTVDYDLSGTSKSLTKEILPQEFVERTFRLPLKCTPGSSYFYSNITAFLLTQIIEKVTGKNFYLTVQEKILTPFGMTASTFFPTDEARLLIPPTEITEDRGTVQGFVHDESTHYLQSGNISSGAAGLFASSSNIAKFVSRALSFSNKEDPFFSEEMVQRFTTNQFVSLLPTITPLGWGDNNNEFISAYRDRFVVKSGFTGCFIIGDLKNKIGVVILSNCTYPIRPKDRPVLNQLKREIIDLLINSEQRLASY